MQVWRKVTSWFPVFAVLVAPDSLLPSFALAQSGGPDDQHIAQFERVEEAPEAAAKKIPRDAFNLQTALLQTDLTPQGLLAWMRNNTRLVPYHRALRGERGVLLDRALKDIDTGNSLGINQNGWGAATARHAFLNISIGLHKCALGAALSSAGAGSLALCPVGGAAGVAGVVVEGSGGTILGIIATILSGAPGLSGLVE